MLGTHGSSRRECVSRQTEQSWPARAGWVDVMQYEAVRAVLRAVAASPSVLTGVRLAWLPRCLGRNDGNQINTAPHTYPWPPRYHTAAPASQLAVCIVTTVRIPRAIDRYSHSTSPPSHLPPWPPHLRRTTITCAVSRAQKHREQRPSHRSANPHAHPASATAMAQLAHTEHHRQTTQTSPSRRSSPRSWSSLAMAVAERHVC